MNSSESTCLDEVQEQEPVLDLLLQYNTSNVCDLVTEGTPQNQAYQWILDDSIIGGNFTNSTNVDMLIQRYAVLVFYFSAVDQTSNNTGFWMIQHELHECDWIPEGIWCRDDGSVYSFYFHDTYGSPASLTGTLPSEIALLPQLEDIYLADENLSGTIPSELSQRHYWWRLWLNNNHFTGTIPSELGDSEFSLLGLAGNNLTGTIPPALSAREILDLSGNQLSGTIPSEFGNLDFTELRLFNNQLVGSIPTEMGQLENADVLDLHGNHLSGTIPTELGNIYFECPLSLYDNGLTGTIPVEVLGLRSVYLQNNSLTGNIPILEGLSDSHYLVNYLNLSGNQLSGPLPTQLPRLKYLLELDASHNAFSGTIVTELGLMTTLESLDLSDNMLTGTIQLNSRVSQP